MKPTASLLMRRPLVWIACTAALAATAASAADRESAAAVRPPNIVLIVADDLGYGDIGSYGNSAVRTPSLDRLAREGVSLRQFYCNAPECSPTRTALLTGSYQQRFGGLECAIGVGNVGRYDDAIRLAEQHQLGLPPVERSMPATLTRQGYRTALVGKWHLGYEPHFSPLKHGFAEWFGVLGGWVDFFHHREEGWPVGLVRNDQPIEREGYLTDLIAGEAVRVVAKLRSTPFFLYVPLTAPHTPLQGPNDWAAERVRKPEQAEKGSVEANRRAYFGMIERLDRGVGDILDALDCHRVTSNTIVVFTSDNGGVARWARNTPFSGGKGSLLEGGIRGPCIVRWPGRIAPSSESQAVLMSMDFAPAFARVAGAKFAPGTYDGIDALAVLTGGEPVPERPLFWRYRRGTKDHRAVRDGELKYLFRQEKGTVREELFDVAADPAEKENLAARRPLDVERLRQRLSAWLTEVKPMR